MPASRVSKHWLRHWLASVVRTNCRHRPQHWHWHRHCCPVPSLPVCPAAAAVTVTGPPSPALQDYPGRRRRSPPRPPVPAGQHGDLPVAAFPLSPAGNGDTFTIRAGHPYRYMRDCSRERPTKSLSVHGRRREKKGHNARNITVPGTELRCGQGRREAENTAGRRLLD